VAVAVVAEVVPLDLIHSGELAEVAVLAELYIQLGKHHLLIFL
jgi:hypothetical protein